MTPLPIPAPRASGTTHSLPVPLYWARYGPSGASPILMLHGGPGASHDYLLPQMLALADQHELLFYDQRGGGHSRTDDPQPITWRTHVEDLGGIAREFSLEPVSILGYSWGGLLAMLYAIEAARDSSRTPPARLVLVEPAPVTREYRQQFEAEFNRRQRSAPISTMREELQQSGLQSRDREAYRQRAFELSVAGYFADPAKARDLTPFRIIERVQRSVWESLGDFDVTAELEAVKCPALVIHGRDDPIPVASSQRAARALGAQLLLLADCGHVPYVERPTEMFDAVSRFLAETEPLG